MSKMPAKKKSCFQITSVTQAQVAASSITDDTESLDDPDESRTEDVSSEIFDVSRVCDRSSSEETLNNVGEPPEGQLPPAAPVNGGLSYRSVGTGRVTPHNLGASVPAAAQAFVSGSATHPTVNSTAPAAAVAHTAPVSTSCSSRFRVIKLDHGTGEPFRRGRWTCTEFYERDSDSNRTVDSIKPTVASDHSIDRDSGLGATNNSAVISSAFSAQAVENTADSGYSVGHPAHPHPPIRASAARLQLGSSDREWSKCLPAHRAQQFVYSTHPSGLSVGQPDYRPQHFGSSTQTLPMPVLPVGPPTSQVPSPLITSAGPGAQGLGGEATPAVASILAGSGQQQHVNQTQPSGGIGIAPAPTVTTTTTSHSGVQNAPATVPSTTNTPPGVVSQAPGTGGLVHPQGAHGGATTGLLSGFSIQTEDSRQKSDALPQPSVGVMPGKDGVKPFIGEGLSLPTPSVNSLFDIHITMNVDEDSLDKKQLAIVHCVDLLVSTVVSSDKEKYKSVHVSLPLLMFLLCLFPPPLKCRNPSTAFYQAFRPSRLRGSKPVNDSASGASVVAIDNKIEQAMDLVKSHLMYAVREEVEVLKEHIKELYERNSVLERENAVLKSLANSEQLGQLSSQLSQGVTTSPPLLQQQHPLVTNNNNNNNSTPLAHHEGSQSVPHQPNITADDKGSARLRLAHCCKLKNWINRAFRHHGDLYLFPYFPFIVRVHAAAAKPSAPITAQFSGLSITKYFPKNTTGHMSPTTGEGSLRREHWKLLSSLKTTVEGLVSTNNPNVWSRYGGLQRLHKDMNNILSHGLKNEQVYYKQRDYWPFVWCVRYISPHLASHVEQFSHLEPVLSSGMQSAGESYKAERWLLHSLQVHMLSAQLRPLLRHLGHTRKYYNDDAFLLSEPHVTAMFQCLEAVEQNNPKLLAQVDTVGLSPLKGPPCLGLLKSQSLCVLPGARGAWRSADLAPKGKSLNRRLTTSNCSLREAVATSHNLGNTTGVGSQNSNNTNTTSPASSLGAPWVCVSRPGENEQGVMPPPDPISVPSIALTESSSPMSLQPEAGDSGDGDYDDGPEYLAIGNLGQRSRRDSQSSTPSSEQGETQDQSLQKGPLDPPPPRCSSFSEGQRGPGRGSRGHTRSFSDTGINQKLRNGGGHRKITIIIEDPVAESASDKCMKDFSPFSPQHSDASTPSSLYMESHGSQYNSISDGMFRKPSEGQSLISYLSEQDFGSCADLEKENAHFSISESLIAAIELMKYNLRRQEEEGEEEGDSDCEIQQLKQKIRLRRQQIRRSRLPPCASSQHIFHSTDSGGSRRSSQDSCQGLSDSGSAEEVEECELRDGCEGQSLLAVSQNGLSLSLASLFSDADIKRSVGSSNKSFLSSDSISPSFLQSNSAESVAMGLLRQFEGMQLPAASELDWLVPEHDAPQKLLPIPDSLPISPDDGEHADIYKLRIRVRGNLEWAPPRPQRSSSTFTPPLSEIYITYTFSLPLRRKIVVAKQNYRLLRWLWHSRRSRHSIIPQSYLYNCCHENAQVVVPGRVLRKWDFSKYYVSNFARDLLTKIAGDPLFNPNDINSGLYKKIKALEAIRVLRVQLFHMKNLFKTCRFAKEVLDQFDSLPGHLTEDLHLFSLNDLTAVRNGDLAPRMKELLKLGTMHVAGCVVRQLCLLPGHGSRAPSPRPSFPFTWKDWKIAKPRRLERALYQDRKEGEGGEEDLELDQGPKCGEKEEDAAEVRQGRRGIFQVFVPGKLVKAFSRSKGNEDEQEMTGETETEEETKCDEGREEGGNDQQERLRSKERGDGHARREKVNLLKVLHIDRLKKSISKGDRRDSDSETCSSLESLDEVGQERKRRWKVPGLARVGKSFTKKEAEDEAKTEVKESEIKHLEKVTETDEEGKARRESEKGDEISDKGQTEAAETAKPGAETTEKFTLMKLPKPHQLSAIVSGGRSRGEEDRSAESGGKREVDAEEEGQQKPAVITRTNWRG
ncbi:hypothetical protein L3Q82_025687 [Scortum barcoo]|uniref:Uncharacterized protein n=1 Tax=Scortum barcoo TaxID=214431 RepID=A0ACB8WPU1_9TELE|nr:hypothetical protein L3Q82_025687 [Scortum barcoo]